MTKHLKASVAVLALAALMAGIVGQTRLAAADSPQYLCPQSSERLLTSADLEGADAKRLYLMRNEIYARHGRSFDRKDLQEYFYNQPWYQENPYYTDDLLSAVEQRNAAFILRREEAIYSVYLNSDGPSPMLCPQSNQRLLVGSDVKGKSAHQLYLMRNEIYARHGRPFKNRDLVEYFNVQSWYQVNPHYSDNLLSRVEHRNIAFILKRERALHSPYI